MSRRISTIARRSDADGPETAAGSAALLAHAADDLVDYLLFADECVK